MNFSTEINIAANSPAPELQATGIAHNPEEVVITMDGIHCHVLSSAEDLQIQKLPRNSIHDVATISETEL
ncbi:uncharacterized protein RHIMIDRAFT_236379 [Rhizopus microsporus ATCC 52813]|uniref:Uncharacterized protein n=1 Tax=Rhizopus microsporus ATCC 52813 TaxID=1340429 RepID=A0A2G4SX28_RHIZD|nr:uncharacterized protein RHIMIDRAFT_236379 [Rhizopus microsporus ATCC 52813]PHZ13302.1 hypothetical protein RHIMIDRAFT_236379 [Rhizopus microsporus ATCC 52813]